MLQVSAREGKRSHLAQTQPKNPNSIFIAFLSESETASTIEGSQPSLHDYTCMYMYNCMSSSSCTCHRRRNGGGLGGLQPPQLFSKKGLAPLMFTC